MATRVFPLSGAGSCRGAVAARPRHYDDATYAFCQAIRYTHLAASTGMQPEVSDVRGLPVATRGQRVVGTILISEPHDVYQKKPQLFPITATVWE